MPRCFSVLRKESLFSLLVASLAACAFSASAIAGSMPPSDSPVVSFGTLPVLQASTPIPGSSYVPGDFNGDGTSDLLWFNPGLSQVGYWTMSAVTDANYSVNDVTSTGTRIFNVTPGYFVGAVGDFNNDGYADLVFTSANRELWLWTNNKNDGFSSEYMGTYPSEWQLIGAGDVDGDGYDDLLWLNPSQCQFAYWTMRGTTRTGYKILPITCDYYPVGIGYYSPSSRISILWTSPAHDLYVWDSTTTGFRSYGLDAILGRLGFDFAHVWTIGGGFMGKDIGAMWAGARWGQNSDIAGIVISRNFDTQGNQTDAYVSGIRGVGNPPSSSQGSGGYLIRGGRVNRTALYQLDQATNLLTTDGIPGPNYSPSMGNVPVGEWNKWTYPAGWWIVGAPVNKTNMPPW